MLKEMKEYSEVVESPSIDFRTAKNINNDFIDLLRALGALKMRSEVGKEIKERYIKAIACELEKLESSKIIL